MPISCLNSGCDFDGFDAGKVSLLVLTVINDLRAKILKVGKWLLCL